MLKRAPLEGDVIIPASGFQHWWYSINGFRMNSFVCTLQTVPPQSDCLFSVFEYLVHSTDASIPFDFFVQLEFEVTGSCLQGDTLSSF